MYIYRGRLVVIRILMRIGICGSNITFLSFSQVTLIPEEAEDMWHSYNLLQVGDSLRASTIR